MTQREPEPGRAGKILGTLGALALFRRLAKKQRDDYFAPTGMYRHDARSEKLVGLAYKLVDENAPDQIAIDQLRDAAGRRRESLLRAAAMVRFNGAAEDYAKPFRANALLVSAGTGIEVRHPTAEQTQWFARIASLEDVDPEVGFGRVAALEPGLVALRNQLAAKARTPAETAAMTEDESEALWEAILGPLDELVGPESSHPDPLVRSAVAFDVARLHLAELVGARFNDEAEEGDNDER